MEVDCAPEVATWPSGAEGPPSDTLALGQEADALLLRLRVLAAQGGSELQSPQLLASELHALADCIASLPEAKPTEPTDPHGEGSGPRTDSHLRNETETDSSQPVKRQKKVPREFDFSQYQQRHVVLEVLYLGWSFQGFARQDSTDNTIEAQLFKAMRRTRLIAEDVPISSLKYSRCGRTDKGVSALGQVIALMLRSSGKAGQEEIPVEREMDYPRVLNKALPPEIRVLGWTTAPADFSARFSATYREYKYFIVQQAEAGQPPRLDVERMQEAANHFVGDHDFRNFCKPDVASVRSFRRKILHFLVEPVGLGCHPLASAGSSQYVARKETVSLYALNVRGTAFLWHQVRCMASVLLMVGLGQEEPDIVARMLDIQGMPRKPQYQMAPEDPLLLYECGFKDLELRRTERMAANNLSSVAASLEKHLIAAAMVSTVRARLLGDEKVQVAGEHGSGGSGNHIPLLKRQMEPSLEERLQRFDESRLKQQVEEDEPGMGE